MKTCEFCMFAGDECFLLNEPIEYDSSGMTTPKDNCPMKLRDKYIKDICDRIKDARHDDKIQVPDTEWQNVRSISERDKQCAAVYRKENRISNREDEND